jgi:hypothetical protein
MPLFTHAEIRRSINKIYIGNFVKNIDPRFLKRFSESVFLREDIFSFKYVVIFEFNMKLQFFIHKIIIDNKFYFCLFNFV